MPNILLINLNKDKSRLFSTLDELYAVGQSDYITRIEACDKKMAEMISYKYISHKAEENIENPISTGILPNYAAVGCAISHIKCWKYIIDNNIEDVFVVEDDIQINNIKKYKNDLCNIKRIIAKNKNQTLFIGFNIRTNYKNDTYDYYQNFKVDGIHLNRIQDMFCGTSYYYINNQMATLLYDSLININYQIDLEIGKLAKNYIYNPNIIFLNFNTNSLTTNSKFKSTIQFYNISLNELVNIFNISEDIADCIYKYIPDCFKSKREQFISNNYILGNI